VEAEIEPNSPIGRNVSSSKTTKSKTSKAKPKAKLKPEGFPSLTASLEKWVPSDPSLTRSILVGEVRKMLEAESYACIPSCVPALIVDGKYPIEVMHFRTRDDIDEFVTRMVWMHEVFKSSIGIFVGVPDPETSNLIVEVCSTLLRMDEDCVVILL